MTQTTPYKPKKCPSCKKLKCECVTMESKITNNAEACSGMVSCDAEKRGDAGSNPVASAPTETTLKTFGPFKSVPYRFHHKTGGWFNGRIYFLNIKNWVSPLGIFWALRGDDFCLNYAVIKDFNSKDFCND